MPEIPGVTALHGDGEPGLDLVGPHTRTHTHNLPSLLFTEAYHIAKLEKPRQKMAYRFQGPLGLVQPMTGVNLCSLTFCPRPSSSFAGAHVSFGWPDSCLFSNNDKKKGEASPFNSVPKLMATQWLCNSLMAGSATLAVVYLTQETDISPPRFT